MPAILTHHIFGEDASALLPDGILEKQEDLLAFLLGNQGPDPLWARFSTTPRISRSCHQLATRMHSEHIVDSFLVLRDSVSHLRDSDKGVGRAFALGIAAHYLLDCLTHPLLYAQQQQLIDANPDLEDAADEVHALLESEIDTWTLWQTRHKTVLDAPSSSALSRTPLIESVTGSLLAQLAWEVFDIDLGPAEYAKSVQDYTLFYQLIDPPAQKLPHVLARIERIKRAHSRLLAQAHEVWESDECAAANLEHRRWRNPYTGECSTASFPDLFHDAILAWPAFAQRFIEGDRERLGAMVDNIDYYGRPSVP